MSSPLPTLITQLRAAYPNASLLSELLAIESNTFVVRALIQMGSFTLATGLAASPDLETAEDRAKGRAIETLLPSVQVVPAVIPPASGSTSAIPTHGESASEFSPAPLADQAADALAAKVPLRNSAFAVAVPPVPPLPSPSASVPPEALTDWDNPLLSSSGSTFDPNFDLNTLLQENSTLDNPNSALSDSAPSDSVLPDSTLSNSPLDEAQLAPPAADLFSAVNADPSLSIDPPVNLADLNLTRLNLPKADPPTIEASEAALPARSEKPARRKSAAAPPAEPDFAPAPALEPAPPAEIDRSEEIARIGVEMKRLGWDTKKGRDHLQKTYGKRSRQELNDDELMDFLRYLETQPSSAQMPF